MTGKKKKSEWVSAAIPKAPTDPAEVERLVAKAADALAAAGAEDVAEEEEEGLAGLRRRAKAAPKRS